MPSFPFYTVPFSLPYGFAILRFVLIGFVPSCETKIIVGNGYE